MNKPNALCCLLSAVGGGLVALWLTMPSGLPRLSAGEATPLGSHLPRIENLPSDEYDLTAEERVNVSVYESVNRSVVNISTEVPRTDIFSFFEVPAEGAGSGSVLDTDGRILTNYHVIDGARKIEVTLHDGKSYDARLVGKDESNDVAVIQINAPAGSLFPVTLGESRHLRVGQRVYAIGNPFGLERTLTTGIISSVDRTLPTRHRRIIKSIIQIDAAINPGNSGGPLLDTHGRLIGMNTAIASATGQSSGVGFAIPVAVINRVVPQLIERGRVIRPDSGITRGMQTEKGLLIATMAAGGPAEQAGLRGFRLSKQRKSSGIFNYESTSIDRTAADLIVAINGEKVVTAADFLAIIESHQPGEEVTITVVRDGHEVQIPLRLIAAEQ
ncbi:MAG TPA: trypsin-like peptidase domain-containing protein [Pirellulales bacterium]|nr:trypsin-like peptidase domain-containing protein [Pirellulales bacterium]